MSAPRHDDDASVRGLGRRIADDLGTGASPARSRRHEEALVALVGQESLRRPPKAARWWIAAAAALILISGVSSWWFWPREHVVEHTYGELRFARADGTVLEGAAGEARRLQFVGGSEITVHHRSAVRVLDATEQAVEVALDRGVVDASIEGNGTTRWSVVAGPYRVVVVGTVFTVDWNPRSAELHVRVDEGVVRVEGEGLTDHGVEITAGKQLRADASRTVVFLGPVEPSTVAGAGDAVAAEPAVEIERAPAEVFALQGPGEVQEAPIQPAADEDLVVESVLAPVEANPAEPMGAPESSVEQPAVPGSEQLAYVGPESANPSPPAPPTWQALYAAGEFGAAAREARAQGLDRVVASTAQDDLWKLADAARISGDGDLAALSLSTYRDRFAASHDARTAAYLLGRIALEERGDASGAIQWFDTYLAEAPEGPLAEEALGRSILAHDQLGRVDGARECARIYLDRFPEGTFASLASSVVGE